MLDRHAVAELYDRHAPRLYALAMRIAGNAEAAGDALEEAFLELCRQEGTGDPIIILLRATRDAALARQGQKPSPTVLPSEGTPRRLVEDAWYGMSVSDLAKTYGIPEHKVRGMLRDGMAELRSQFAAGTK